VKLADLKFEAEGYLAFVLDQSTKRSLQQKYPCSFYRDFTDHVTILFPVKSDRSLDEIKKYLGEPNPAVVLTGYAIDKTVEVECFTATVGGKSERNDGSFYHLTHSIGEGKSPVASNALLKALGGIPQKKLDIPVKGEYCIIKFGR